MKIADIIGAPHPLVTVWAKGYHAGRLLASPKKNPYWDDDWQRPVKGEEHKYHAWEDGRRLGVEELWHLTRHNDNRHLLPVWVGRRIDRPRRGLRPV